MSEDIAELVEWLKAHAEDGCVDVRIEASPNRLPHAPLPRHGVFGMGLQDLIDGLTGQEKP